jgi:hypothetical protein
LDGVDFVIAVDHSVHGKREVVRAQRVGASHVHAVSRIEDDDTGSKGPTVGRWDSGYRAADDVSSLFAELNVRLRLASVGYLNLDGSVARG